MVVSYCVILLHFNAKEFVCRKISTTAYGLNVCVLAGVCMCLIDQCVCIYALKKGGKKRRCT